MIKRLILASIIMLVMAGNFLAQSADTVYVPANKPDGTPYINSLIEKVVADTNAQGKQLHKVYKLERGNFYLLDKAISVRNAIQLVADPPVKNDPLKTPPKILSNITASGGTATGSLIITWKDITIKNIWLAGGDLGGQNHGWGDRAALLVQDSLVTVKLDGVWCDYNSWSAIGATRNHTRWHINNFHARNEQNDGDQWTTFLFYFPSPAVTEIDTFIVTNSSYFQSNGPFFMFNANILYFKVDHCTFVNTYKHPFHQTQWLDATITNNIFYNAGGLSMTKKENESQDPHGLPFGLVDVDTLFGNSLNKPTQYTIPEKNRSIVVKNNLWFYSSEITSYWASHDTVLAQPFMNTRTTAMFNNKTTWPGLIASGNVNQDPKFNDFPRITEANAKFAKACTDIRAGSTHGWDWDGDQLTDPTNYRLMIQYPTTENFRSSSGLKGTDGNPLGDLSFYNKNELVGIEENPVKILPTEYTLEQNYPNPFNPSTEIKFAIPKAGFLSLKVFNVLGQEVATLINAEMSAGNHSVTFKATNLASGLYIYKLSGENISLTKKMMLLK